MEPLSQGPGTDPDHQLPPGGNKVQRVSSQTRTLIQEVKTWIDLRISLTKLEIQQELEARKTELALTVAMALLGGLGGFFLLITLALMLGAWLGEAFWGFLIITALLFIGAAVMYAVKPGMVEDARDVRVEREDRDGTPSP